MVTQLNGEGPASKMLTPVPNVLEERRQLTRDLFQPATKSSFAKMVDTIAHLCSLSEGKNQRCSSHEGDTVDRTNKPYIYTELSPVAVDKPVHSADSVDFTLDLDGVKPLEDAKPKKPVKLAKAMKLAASSKITKVKKSPTYLTCLLCYGNPKRGGTQILARSDSFRNHYRQVHFQYQVGPFPCPLLDCKKIIHDSDHFANHAVTAHSSDLEVRAAVPGVVMSINAGSHY